MSTEMKLLSILAQTGLHGGRNIPAMLQGLPGIAKTQVIVGLGEEISRLTNKDFPVEVFTAPQRMPEEVGGVPVAFYEEEEVRCLPMRLGKALLRAGQGIAFVDEFSSANQAMGGALMTMIQDGRLGELELPHSVARIAAMNPPDCAAAGRTLTPPESNRFCWINWKLELNDWIDYMRGGKGTLRAGVALPPNWEEEFGMKAKGLVISYLQRNQERFDVSKTMPKAHDASQPWASPRSWENSARLLAACMAVGEMPDTDLAYWAVAGCIGEDNATAFLGWYRNMKLPDPEELLKDPKNAYSKLPHERADQLQVALESLATAAITPHKDIKKRWNTAWKIIGPVLKEKQDCAFYAAKILASATKKIPDAEVPPEAAIVRDIMKDAGFTAAR